MTDLVSGLDANGDGSISKDEWVQNLVSCSALHARIALGIGDDGSVTNFRDFHEQFAKRTEQVAELEAKAERTEEEEATLTSFKKQIQGLQKRIDERNSNLLKVTEWGGSVFEQFDTDNSGTLNNKELSRALKSLPRKKPKYSPPNTKFQSVDEMITTMDADGDGMVSKEEWLDGISKCSGLCAALFDAQVDGAVLTFRSFEQQKAKREGEVKALEAKATRTEEEEVELASYKKQIESLGQKIGEANANKKKMAASV